MRKMKVTFIVEFQFNILMAYASVIIKAVS